MCGGALGLLLTATRNEQNPQCLETGDLSRTEIATRTDNAEHQWRNRIISAMSTVRANQS